ncbi:hypothetical protein K503DRAFT_775105 [Rhizopogon vinicolor AM-OR11-026]|uniref:Uncharacterized protein n=1 Tax=Rhizopogon vinicolor AM-OR11-026 TaxID=1314800 RepID=A0A1B7MMQ0_9AGAM|nr:hypothetical protein K503DRAFT_775105 [Rhizopogon vinicolor AM-OR11-026]
MSYPLLGSRWQATFLPRANPVGLTGRTAEVCPQQSLIGNVFSYIEPRVTMRFSFLVIITAFTASMSVSACMPHDDICHINNDCCSYNCVNNVSTLYPTDHGVGYCK